MGNFLTSEAENAVPGNPLASPKTHTPFSRKSNLGAGCGVVSRLDTAGISGGPKVGRQRQVLGSTRWRLSARAIIGTLWSLMWLLRPGLLSVLLACSCVSSGPNSTWKEYGNGLRAKTIVIDDKTTNWQLWIGASTNQKMVTELYSENGWVWTCMPSVRMNRTYPDSLPTRMAMFRTRSAWRVEMNYNGPHYDDRETKIPWEDLPEALRQMEMRGGNAIILSLTMPVFMGDLDRLCSILGRSGIAGVLVELRPGIESADPTKSRGLPRRPTEHPDTEPQSVLACECVAEPQGSRAGAADTPSTQAILAEIVSGKVEWNAVCESYWRALSLEDPDAGIAKALKAAVTATDGDLRTLIIDGAVWNKVRRVGRATPTPLLAAHIPLWRELLEDTARRWTNVTVTSRLAAYMEVLCGENPAMPFEHDTLVPALGEEVAAVFIRRAQQRLEGQERGTLVPLPSAARVSNDDRKRLGRQLMACPVDKLDAAVAGLTLDQRLALRRVMDGDPALNARLVPYANRVVTTALKGKQDPELASRVAAFKGKTLTAEAVRVMIDLCRREVERGRFVTCMVLRKTNLRGVSIELESQEPKRFEAGREHYWEESCVEVRVASGGGRNAIAVWPVVVSREVREAANKHRFTDDQGNEHKIAGYSPSCGPADEADRTELWERLDRFLSAEVNAAVDQSIFIQGEVGRNE